MKRNLILLAFISCLSWKGAMATQMPLPQTGSMIKPIKQFKVASPGLGYYMGNGPESSFIASTDPSSAPYYYVNAYESIYVWLEHYNTSYWAVDSYVGSEPSFGNLTAYCWFGLSSGSQVLLRTYDMTNSTTYYVWFVAQ